MPAEHLQSTQQVSCYWSIIYKLQIYFYIKIFISLHSKIGKLNHHHSLLFLCLFVLFFFVWGCVFCCCCCFCFFNSLLWEEGFFFVFLFFYFIQSFEHKVGKLAFMRCWVFTRQVVMFENEEVKSVCFQT